MGTLVLAALLLASVAGLALVDDVPGPQSLVTNEPLGKVEALESRLHDSNDKQEALEAVAARTRTGALDATSMPDRQSLRALENRALRAQALERYVEEFDVRLKAHRDQLHELAADVKQIRRERDEVRQERDALLAEVTALKKVQERQDRLLAMYRSGNFEYYQVRQGDTTTSIASNAMVYGDSKRAVWIEHANLLSSGQPLAPGIVLVIPRFSEGVMHDF